MKTASETLVEKVSGAATRQHQSIKEFRTTSACTIFGYDEGGFVVMSNNDLLPEVLGYSSSVYRTTASSNPNFEWWLNAISEAGDYYVKNNIKFSAPLPDAETHKPFVDALITTRWGQMEPYNNLCLSEAARVSTTGKTIVPTRADALLVVWPLQWLRCSTTISIPPQAPTRRTPYMLTMWPIPLSTEKTTTSGRRCSTNT